MASGALLGISPRYQRYGHASAAPARLKSITGIETPSSFLGKTRFTPLLKVSFTNDRGQPDSMAWQVADLGGVKTALESAIR